MLEDNAEEKLTSKVGEHGTAKLRGRDHEFRESTPRQCRPVGSEDLRGEFQGNSDGSQPAEVWEETHKDFCNCQT